MAYRDRFKAARATGHRSGLEVSITDDLVARGVEFEYEPLRIPFMPTKTRHYKPDYVLANGIVVEAKGEFASADRTKHVLIKEQHPAIDIRFVFSRALTRISKTSKTTYAQWCVFKKFIFAEKRVPQAWVDEPVNQASLDALEALRHG